jgi:hypothetical protein
MFSMEGFAGVSVYIPGAQASTDALYQQMQWYKDAGWEQAFGGGN